MPCGTGCQITHSNGVGQTFSDCNPLDTYTPASAVEACKAYATQANCEAGWTCGCGTIFCGIQNITGCNDYEWGYSGLFTGGVYLMSVQVGTWN